MALNQQRMVHDLIEAVKLKRQKKPNRKDPLEASSLSLVHSYLLTRSLPPAYDADGSTTISTNRGNKLRRNAQYVQRGYLNSPNGVPLFKHVGLDPFPTHAAH
jgi:hypothetical protein